MLEAVSKAQNRFKVVLEAEWAIEKHQQPKSSQLIESSNYEVQQQLPQNMKQLI